MFLNSSRYLARHARRMLADMHMLGIFIDKRIIASVVLIIVRPLIPVHSTLL